MMTAATVARDRGGIRTGSGWAIRCPVPGHGKGRGDRNPSCTIRDSEVGLLVFCHAGCDRHDILRALDLDAGPSGPRTSRRREVSNPSEPRPNLSDAQRRHLAVEAWDEAVEPCGTIVEHYLRTRGLELPPAAGDVLRFHPACPWRDGERTIRVPAMVAAMRAIDGDELVALHRTRLAPDGRKVDRRMLGPAGAAAVKIDPDEHVLAGLAVGEGIETCLAARKIGIAPVWALASAGAVARFPVLEAIQSLTILAEHDDTSRRAVASVAERWHSAGREVIVVHPVIGKDVNEAIRGAA